MYGTNFTSPVDAGLGAEGGNRAELRRRFCSGARHENDATTVAVKRAGSSANFIQ